MNVSILRRIEAIERTVGRGIEPPEMIMIHYDDSADCGWKIVEHYPSCKEKNSGGCKVKTIIVDRLQDYYFPANFNGRVILDAFASPDSAIHGGMYCFDIEELRDGQPGEVAIQAITDSQESIIVQVDVCVRS